MSENSISETGEGTSGYTCSPLASTSAERDKQSRQTRHSSMLFGLGNAITVDDAEIHASRLPTCEQVLCCLMYHIQEGASDNRTRWQSAKLVLSKVAVFYEKANIPIIAERNACEK